MNKKNLQIIFNKYIDNFEFLNGQITKANDKWAIAQEFQSFDVDAPDFVTMLKYMWKASGNLIDHDKALPFQALIDYAQNETETIREMLKNLFSAASLDNALKQKAISEFIDNSETLRKKYSCENEKYKNYKYENNQCSVMQYLFFRYPNSNYSYKATEAKRFAACIEFYDDWGPMTNFRLDIFARMCDQVVEEIKKNDALIEIHKSRFANAERPLYPDDNLHILVADIIHVPQTYDFYRDVPFSSINAEARRIYFDKVAKAKEAAETLNRAEEDFKRLLEATDYISSHLKKGDSIVHKSWGEGRLEAVKDNKILAFFHEKEECKCLQLSTIVSNQLVTFKDEQTTSKMKLYAPTVGKESQIREALTKAREALEPYLEYLD